jgi:hypothetical protein
VGSRKLEITTTAFRLCAYTAREAGVAVLAHTDAGTVDFFVDGSHHENALPGVNPDVGGIVRLRAGSPRYYEFFDLIGPIPPEMLADMGEQYTQLIQARLSSEEMDQLLEGL